MNQAADGGEAVPLERSAHCGEASRALDDMVADTESMGLYDEDPEAIREALKEARAERAST